MKWHHSKAVAFAMDILLQKHRDAEEKLILNPIPLPESQSYQITSDVQHITVSAGDEAGMMYALLDLTEIWESRFPADLKISEKPYIKKRGIKLNLPLDARTPSYSDASDSAFENISDVWDRNFWTEFLDKMALHKYNVLTLWNLSPFPSLVKIPEYPELTLDHVMRSSIPPRPEMSGKNMWTQDMRPGLYTVLEISMDEKIRFWQWVMEYAQTRCIRVYFFTWNLFVYGTEDNPYGITCDQHNPVTIDYIYRAVLAMLETYPLLAGFGITSGENMAGDDTDIPFLKETYGRAFAEYVCTHPDRRPELIHRMQYARFAQITECFADAKYEFSVSFKYSQAHMHSSAKPGFFRAFLECNEHIPFTGKFWLTLRDDDYYLYRWGGMGFTREFVSNLPVNEIHGFYLGADGFTWGRDYTSTGPLKELYLEKMWFKFDLIGQLSYSPDRSDDFFIRKIEKRFHISNGLEFLQTWECASGIFSSLQCTHWNDFDFQWVPEACCRFLHPPVAKLVFSDINEFISCRAMPFSGYISVMDYCSSIMREESITGISPLETVGKIAAYSEQVLLAIPELLKTAVESEYIATLNDMQALALLGRYYALKLEAAVALGSFRLNRSKTELQQKAVSLLETAATVWKEYSNYSTSLYKPQRLTRMGGRRVDVRQFDRYAELDVELARKQ